VPGFTPRLEGAIARLGLDPEELIPYGREVAKVPLAVLDRPRTRPRPPRLILVSAITPTPAGEGKTTTAIGLADAFARLGDVACVALREPSLGPCLGAKGGGTGGGAARLVPSERINLHFTGDFHAVTTAHNLLAALVDHHLHFGNTLGIDPRRVVWRRVIDLDDRALRQIVIGLGGTANGIPRETGFDITAASEVMAILCLARSPDDLRARLARTLVAFTRDGRPVTADDLRATGAMLVLLRDALLPNLVATAEGTPALVHGGPFANIAHGCSSVLGTRLGLQLADWVVTEAGFGFDLGAEKFFHIACPAGEFDTAAVVLVATVRALKLHGGVPLTALGTTDPAAVRRGLPNLEQHASGIACFGEQPIVALNRFAGDTEAEIDVVREFCAARGLPFAVADPFARGGEGTLELAQVVASRCEAVPRPFRPLYEPTLAPREKIRTITRTLYGARDAVFTPAAERDLAEIDRLGHVALPVCMAKTNTSLSDDPHRLGRPSGFDITVRGVHPNPGAGFLVVVTGDILRMPGMPREPLATRLDLRDGKIVGLS